MSCFSLRFSSSINSFKVLLFFHFDIIETKRVNKFIESVCVFFLFSFGMFSASGCPIANRNKLRALEMESVVEKQRHMTVGNGGNTSSLLVSNNPNSLSNNNNNGNGSNNIPTSNSHSYMSSLPLTSLVPSSSVSLSSQTLSTSTSATKIDGINCPTVGEYFHHNFTR